jgi:hypothetical protein
MGTLSLETRKTRLLHHIYNRLLEDGNTYEWIDVLDAIQDVVNNSEGLKEWTVTKDCELVFR